MSLDQLIATMEARGAAEVEEILQGARAEALGVSQAALDAMRRRRETLIHEHERQWKNEANAAVADARRTAAAEVLEARATALERVWRRAREILSEDSIAQRLRVVAPAHVSEALPYLEGKDIVVRCGAPLADAVRTAAQRDAWTVAVTIDDDQAVGVVVAAADGSVSIDNTLPARLARLRPQLATEVTSRLATLASRDRGEAGHAGVE